jgi:hypothetical protein
MKKIVLITLLTNLLLAQNVSNLKRGEKDYCNKYYVAAISSNYYERQQMNISLFHACIQRNRLILDIKEAKKENNKAQENYLKKILF